MAESSVFPVFIKVENIDGGGLKGFNDALATSLNKARRTAEASVEEIQQVLSSALNRGDYGTSGLRQSAAAADERARSARQLATAMQAEAAATGDYSAATQLAIVSQNRMAAEQEKVAATARLSAEALERSAQVAQRNGIALAQSAEGHLRLATSAGAVRQATLGATQQLQDIAISLVSGQRAGIVFAQQLPQLAFALSGLGIQADGTQKGIGRFAAFLSGPWGLAIGLAVGAASYLADSLINTGSAADEAAKKIDRYSDAVNRLNAAQGRATALDVGDAQAKVFLLQGKINNLNKQTSGNRGGAINRAQERQQLESELSQAQAAFASGNKRLDVQRKLALLGANDNSSGASKGSSGSRSSGAVSIDRNQQELDQIQKSLMGKYDVLGTRMAEYADTVADIDKLLAAKRIPADIAEEYKAQAKQALRAFADKDVADQAAARLRESNAITGDLSGNMTDGQKAQYAKDLADITRSAFDPSIDAAQQIADNLYSGADAIAEAFGPKFARLLDELAQISGKDSPLSNLLEGVGAGKLDYKKSLSTAVDKVFGEKNVQKIGKGIGEALGAAGVGQFAGNTVLGSSNSRTGSAIGGALGNVAGKAVGKALGGVFKELGGPIGSILGGVLGGVIGGLFKKTPNGSVSIGGNAAGNLAITGTSGNSANAIKAATSGGNAAITSVQQIADALNATIDGSKGSVSIGTRGEYYRVSGDANASVGAKKTKHISNLIYDGTDAEAAVRAATSELIKDGVITGLRDSTQRLLKAGTDLDAALKKALDFESVFTRLKAYTDPVGSALDTLDKEFKHLQTVFKEAGASTQEYADIEKLYGIERTKAITEAGEKVTASLKSLFDDLTTNNDALSLRTRKGTAQATYDALATRVAAGDKAAYDDFSTAATTLLDIQRQISGSTTDYFTLLDQVTNLTKTRIDAETNISSISASRPGLFGTTSADSAAPIVSATQQQTAIMSAAVATSNSYLAAMADNIVRLNRSVDALAVAGTSVLPQRGAVKVSNF